MEIVGQTIMVCLFTPSRNEWMIHAMATSQVRRPSVVMKRSFLSRLVSAGVCVGFAATLSFIVSARTGLDVLGMMGGMGFY